MHYYVLIFLSILKYINGDVIIETNDGKVKGIEVASILEDEKFYSFMGIPYALPPVGKLRFMPPKPHTVWDDVLDTTREPNPCAQFNFPIRKIKTTGYCGQEDCLKVSVHTPKLPSKQKLDMPVIVFLYNELFRLSYNASRDYGPDFFMSEDVVIVFVHHRINSLGFLSFEDDVLPGNNGLRDVILALKWIKTNIQAFGGDPSKVTLMGNQGGAVMVDILLHSPKAKGLFHKAILQSDTSWSSQYLPKNSREKAIALSKILERTASTSSSFLDRLSDVPAMNIVEVEHQVIETDESREIQRGVFPFSPIIEHDHPDAVITEYPENSNLGIEIPVIIGYNSRESIEYNQRHLHKPQYLSFADRDFAFVFPIRVNHKFQVHSSVYSHAMKEIRDFYFDEGYVKVNKQGEYMTYVEDLFTFYPIDYAVRHYTNASKAAVYYYTFDYNGEFNMRKKNILQDALNIDGTWGASTADELCYLFVCKPIKKAYKAALKDKDSEELKVLKTMVRLWTNFAKHGNPTPPGEEFTWIAATPENKECLVISDEPQVKTNLHESRVTFWDTFLAKYAAMAKDGLIKDLKDEL